jgi:ABC-type protease/lipase transport system fused ATPase/permease subunit
VTKEEILDAARATYVDRLVHSLPDGYDPMLDDEDGNVSAGEKQQRAPISPSATRSSPQPWPTV